MKKLVLVICFVELTFVMGRNFNEKMSPNPKFAQMQRPKSSEPISYQRAGQNEKIKRILHFMNFIDPNCLKKFQNEFRYYQRPFGMLRPLRMSAFRNNGNNYLDQISYYHKMRQNRLKEPQNRKYFGNDRIIFVPPYVKFEQKRLNKTTLSNSVADLQTEKLKNMEEIQGEISVSESSHQKEEHRKYNHTFPLKEEIHKTEEHSTNKNLAVEIKDIQKTIGPRKDQLSIFSPKYNNITSTTTKTYPEIPPRYFWPQTRPTKIQPYEVEEIIEELSADVNDEKSGNFKKPLLGGPPVLGKNIKKISDSEDGQKIQIFHDVIGSSINTVLKTLMAPMAKKIPSQENNREFLLKEQFQNRLGHTNYFTSTSPRYRTLSDRYYPSFYGTTIRPSNRQEQSKHLKISNTQINEEFAKLTQKPTESTTALSYDSKLSLTSTWRTEYEKTVYTTNTSEISYTPMYVPTEKNNLKLTENSRQNVTAVNEAEILSTSSEPEHNSQSLFTIPLTQKSLNDFTTQKKSFNSSTSSHFSEVRTTLNEAFSTAKELTTKPPITDLPEKSAKIFTEEAEDLTATQNMGAEESSSIITINEAELSTPNFREFTDYPMTFNLPTTTKTDLKKNSRKMHFSQELSESTSNQITEFGSTGPRRSDILITENFYDYADVDNNLSTLNYLYKLKQKNSFPSLNLSPNLTSESIIRLIPEIVIDLREDKISPEDISILSKIFKKHWSAIMALTNITNLDMLPLLKMKNEEDLKNILEIFLPENTEVTTVKRTETYTNENNEFDYIDEYNDFYQYVLGSEQEEKDKRKKLRPKRNDEDNLKKTKLLQDILKKLKNK